MTAAYTFVLVHGFWHYGELWEPVANALRWSGYKVHTPTIAGFGDKSVADNPSDKPTETMGETGGEGEEHVSPASNQSRWGFAAQTDSISTYLVEHDLTDVVLVGHSYGGAVIQGVAQAVPERIRRLVFHNALAVRDGHAVVDEVPTIPGMPPEGPGNTGMLPPPEYRLWRELMIGDADDKLAKKTYEKLRPCPVKATEKLNLKGFYDLLALGKLAGSYVNATEDIALPHGEQAWHPRFSNRLDVYRLVQLPARTKSCSPGPRCWPASWSKPAATEQSPRNVRARRPVVSPIGVLSWYVGAVGASCGAGTALDMAGASVCVKGDAARRPTSVVTKPMRRPSRSTDRRRYQIAG